MSTNTLIWIAVISFTVMIISFIFLEGEDPKVTRAKDGYRAIRTILGDSLTSEFMDKQREIERRVILGSGIQKQSNCPYCGQSGKSVSNCCVGCQYDYARVF